jgi:chromosomal replication initiator protein
MKEAERIIQIVCNYFERDVNEVISPNQLRENVVPRQMSMYIMRNNTKLSLTEIGRSFIGRKGKRKDHSTVIHSVNTIETLIECGWEYQGLEIMDHIKIIEKIIKRKTEPTLIKLYRYS